MRMPFAGLVAEKAVAYLDTARIAGSPSEGYDTGHIDRKRASVLIQHGCNRKKKHFSYECRHSTTLLFPSAHARPSNGGRLAEVCTLRAS